MISILYRKAPLFTGRDPQENYLKALSYLINANKLISYLKVSL
jgi:hypothetical protein